MSHSGEEVGPASEVVLGEVPVAAQLAVGSDRMRLFFTGTRIIAAHEGKNRAGTGASTSLLLGTWGSGLARVFGRAKKHADSETLETLKPSDILRWDKDNFDIRYQEVVGAELVEEEFYSVIRILTGEEKLEFHTGKHFDDVASLMGGLLGAKLTVRRARGDASQYDDR